MSMLLIDITFVVIFLAGVLGLWYRVTQKIPELVAIPDQVIIEHLHEDSAKVRLFILHIKTFYQEAKYKEVFWKIVGKMLYKFHIVILRIDNSIVRALKKIKTAGILNGNGNGNREYWKQLQDGFSTFTTPKSTHHHSVRDRLSRATAITPTASWTPNVVHEVRKKKV